MNFPKTILALCLMVAVSSATDLPIYNRVPESQADEIRRRVIEAGGCNANICFAIDGSGSISSTEFTNQKNFVLDVASIVGVDQTVELSAVQYATSTSHITPLTVNNAEFVTKVEHARQRMGKSFVTAGINYCFSQLWRRPFDANKIVLLGDGKANVGSSAFQRADLFRKIGGVVAVVSAGKADPDNLLKIAGGKYENVFEVDSFFDVLSLQLNLEELVLDICSNH